MLALPQQNESLETLENQARAFRDAAALNWMKFCRLVLRIKHNDLWRTITNVSSWNDYCKAAFGIGADRISQYKGALAYIEAIQDAGHAMEETEGHLRRLKRVVKPDDPLMIATYTTGQSVAKSLGMRKPSESVYRHAYEQLQEASVTGHVDIDGAQVAANIDGAIESAFVSTINEAKNRNAARIKPREKITGRLTRLGNGWQFVPDSDIDIADNVEVIVYVKEKA